MKKFILLFLMLIFMIPAVTDASYIIHLKNGGRLLTPQYWEENNYVKFYVVGGTMGIEKNSIRKIERSTIDIDGSYEIKTTSKRPARVEPRASMPSALEKEKKEAATDDVKKDPTIMGAFRTLKEKYELRNSMTLTELADFKNDLTVLRDKIFSNRFKYDYTDEANKVAEMRFFVNDLVVTKSKK